MANQPPAAAAANKPVTLPRRNFYGSLSTQAKPAAAVGADPIVNDGTSEHLQLTTVPRSLNYAIPTSTSSGVLAFDVQVVSEPTSRSNKVRATGLTLVTTTIPCMVLSDVPAPPAFYDANNQLLVPPPTLVFSENPITIATADLTQRSTANPHILKVVGQGKASSDTSAAVPKGAPQQKAPMMRYDKPGKERLAIISQGTIIQVQTNKANTAQGRVGLGDILRLAGVTYKVVPGRDNSSTGGRNSKGQFYEDWDAASVSILHRRVEFRPELAAKQNLFTGIMMGLLPVRIPNVPAMVVRADWDAEASAKAFQEAKKKEAHKEAQKEDEGYGIEPGLAPAAEEDDDEGGTYSLDKKAENKMSEEALTPESKRALRNHPWVIPMMAPSAAVMDYHRLHGLPYKVWAVLEPSADGKMAMSPFLDAANPDHWAVALTSDPGQQDQQNQDNRKPEVLFEDPRPLPNGVKRPRMRLALNYLACVTQSLPEEPMAGEQVDEHGKPVGRENTTQNIPFEIKNASTSLYVFGMAHPQSMYYCVRILAPRTPSINMCYQRDKLVTMRATPAVTSAEELPCYHLSGSLRAVDRGVKPEENVPKDIPSFFVDLAAGVVSAGYPIDAESAAELIEWRAEEIGAQHISIDMTDSSVQNPWMFNNPLKKASPVQNWFETEVNFSKENRQFRHYVVSTFALKDFDRFPELRELMEALANTSDPMGNACKFFGKLFVDIARKRAQLGAAPKDLAPAKVAENAKLAKAYADELAKVGGLAELPFDYKRMSVVFGPLHPRGQEPDYTPQTPMPFHCVVYGIKFSYIEKRQGMLNYLGDSYYHDIVVPNIDKAYQSAVDEMTANPNTSYAAFKPILIEKMAEKEEHRLKTKAEAAAKAAAKAAAASAKHNAKPSASSAGAGATHAEGEAGAHEAGEGSKDAEMTDAAPHPPEGAPSSPLPKTPSKPAAKATAKPTAPNNNKDASRKVPPVGDIKGPANRKAKAAPVASTQQDEDEMLG